MAVFTVIVGVALRRPPRTDEYRKIMVEATGIQEATLIATQIAACTSTMPVSAKVEPVAG